MYSHKTQSTTQSDNYCKKVLIVDDSRAILSVLCAQLDHQVGIPYEKAMSLEETRRLLSNDVERFFVAVLDLNLPDAPDGEVVSLVQAYGIPVIVLTANMQDSVRDRMLQQSLVDYVVKRNASEIEYVVNLVELIQQNPQRKVLLVDDSPAFISYLKSLLSVHGYQLLAAENGKQALALMESNQDIELVITDHNMPEMDGAEFIEHVRRTHGRDELAIIGISSPENGRISARLLKAGANDFITKPFEVEEFYCRVNQNVGALSRIKKIREAAVRDYLTGLYNRRYLFELGEHFLNQAQRDNLILAVAMVDADHFKRINDTFGHEIGDRVLVALAGVLQSTLRETDLLARFGGEEFVCLAIGADREELLRSFEKVRESVEALKIAVSGEELKLTVSIGVTTQLAASLEQMLETADQALYDAKQAGRDRVVAR